MKKTEKRKFLRTRLAAACVAAVGGARAAEPAWNMEDLHRSSCRVVGTSGGSATQVGSGLTIGELENDYVVKTNAHVVDGCKSFVVQYFGDGAPLSVDARLGRKFYDSRKQHDVALLTVSRAELGGYGPPIVPLAPPERAEIDAKKPIYACGCPGAREPQAWVGRTIGAFGRLQTFKPAPLQGQSGSGIVQRSPNGWLECRATLTYRSAETAQNYDFDAAHGLAIPVKFLYEAASGRVVDFSAPVPRGIVPLSTKVAEVAESAEAAPPRCERAVWIGEPGDAPLAFAPTRPTLLYFSARWCGACRRSTPVVEALREKGLAIRSVDVDEPEGARAWRAYRFDVVPAFAFVELDAAGEYVATLDAWVGAANCGERIERNFKAFQPRPRPVPRRPPASAAAPLVACRFESPEVAEVAEVAEAAEAAEAAEVAEVAESAEVAATLATDPDEPPIAASETTEADDSPRPLGSVDLPAIAFGESSATSTPRTVDELLAAYERGWTPPFRDAAPSAGPSAGADSEADGGSTAGLIGGAVERAARERIDALASALEEAARTKVGELEAAARLKLDAAAFALEATATSKLETALDGLKRRAFAACAAIAVWGAFVAGGWYWLVRLIAKCWGAAPKYRLVRDSDSSAAGSD